MRSRGEGVMNTMPSVYYSKSALASRAKRSIVALDAVTTMV